MGLLKRIGSVFGSGGSSRDVPRDDGLYFYVQCDHCGARLRIRVDRHNDLLPDYDSGGFHLRKEMLDSRCFRLMYAELSFDRQYNIVGQEISGGHFITREEFEESTN